MLAQISRSFIPTMCSAARFRTSIHYTKLSRRYLSTMKALVYRAVTAVSFQSRPIPTLSSPTDAIIKVTKTTICGTDLHIQKGDMATCQPGRVLGHEGVGIMHSAGSLETPYMARKLTSSAFPSLTQAFMLSPRVLMRLRWSC
jgi:alcohol dehydrogenase